MSRREFLGRLAGAGAAAAGAVLLGSAGKLFAQDRSGQYPDLVAVRNGEPGQMFDSAIAALGGMAGFVKKGARVVIKPNMAWEREAETGANTNPQLVGRIVEHCFNAGASKVYVFDHSVSYWKNCYRVSGIEKAVKDAGGQTVPADTEGYYEKVKIPGASMLKELKVHELILESDVFINVPVLKDHSSTRITMAMKNLMGTVWDRSWYHRYGLHQCIAEFCLFRKPDLNVLDAYRITLRNGPSMAQLKDTELKKNLVVSRDIVALDTAGTLIFGEKPERIGYIVQASQNNIGTMNLDSLNIKRLAL
ncbi:MAG: DUF362 domain-containing protein [Spirochaetales bacterium]|nr:MAG: DUF362 domain-containing protein [Spirochaetales bacterium]